MKILFVDIDGCLNGNGTPMRQTEDGLCLNMDPEMVFRLNRIIDQTGATLVLSSAWRAHPRWRETMQANGILFPFLDRTPDYHSTTDRGCEVEDWLKLSGAAADPSLRYAILDDNPDFHPTQPLFQTDTAVGLTEEIAQRIIAHLNAV